MNAKEARELALKNNTENQYSQFADIKNRINLLASKGKYKLDLYITIEADAVKALKKEGYKITDLTDHIRNEIMYRIEW